MNLRHFLLLPLAAVSLCAEDLNRVIPNAPAQAAAGPSVAAKLANPITLLPAQPHEGTLLSDLKGVIFVQDPKQAAAEPPAGFSGVDSSRVPFVPSAELAKGMGYFIGHPASLASLNRMALVARLLAIEAGNHFVLAYVPPQDLTAGVVRIVVEKARQDGPVKVAGEKHSSPQSYLRVLNAQPGTEIDEEHLSEAIDAINTNPYRQVVLAMSPGSALGTTQLSLQATDQRPLTLTAGYDNTGSQVTGESRVNAGLSWGDAFGRGDVADYHFSADPGFEHFLSHAFDYTSLFKGGYALTLVGAWARIDSVMPVPLSQVGHSWELSLRLAVPLAPLHGLKQRFSFGPDFKYSDNNLEFATIPVLHNVTNIVQFGGVYSLCYQGGGQSASVAFSAYGSPGGLTSHDKDSYYGGARFGAKAEYAYGRIDLQYSHVLPHGFSWQSQMSLQDATGALLGSEELNGAGSSAVRGYRESTAFGDAGIVSTNELHTPALAFPKGSGSVDPFVFVDAASLTTKVQVSTIDLASSGVGLNYAWRNNLTLRAAYGWEMKALPGASGTSSYGHISVTMRY